MGISNKRGLQETRTELTTARITESNLDVFPSRRGEDQKDWEPLRTLSNSNEGRTRGRINRALSKEKGNRKTDRSSRTNHTRSESLQWTTQSSLGGDVDGSSDWMDYGDVCKSVCNRTDELRLLGNGVVPATAARAFRVLWEEIKKDSELD